MEMLAAMFMVEFVGGGAGVEELGNTKYVEVHLENSSDTLIYRGETKISEEEEAEKKK